MHEDILASALGLYGIGSILEAKRVTLREFNVRKRGYLIQHLERERGIHLQVYLDRLVEATNRSGENYLYSNFDDFYNEAKARSTVLGNGHNELVSSDLIATVKRRRRLSRKGDNNG